MELNIQQINSILKNLESIRRRDMLVAQTKDEFENSIEIYRTEFDGVFVRLEVYEDSYGENEYIGSVQFVKPVVKEVTDFDVI